MQTFEEIFQDDLKTFQNDLQKFIWDFAHGDNITYNAKVLVALRAARRTAKQPDLFHKPITIQIVSLIEAVLVDFLTRLDQATTHLPKNVDPVTLATIKTEIEKTKRLYQPKNESNYICMRRKMYQLRELVDVFERFELFGPKGGELYKKLRQFGDLRNRVHIENYYGNFEKKETEVFTGPRLRSLEAIFVELWELMVTDYRRPWAEQRSPVFP